MSEPAFPVPSDINPSGAASGLTKLEYAKIELFKGILANPKTKTSGEPDDPILVFEGWHAHHLARVLAHEILKNNLKGAENN